MAECPATVASVSAVPIIFLFIFAPLVLTITKPPGSRRTKLCQCMTGGILLGKNSLNLQNSHVYLFFRFIRVLFIEQLVKHLHDFSIQTFNIFQRKPPKSIMSCRHFFDPFHLVQPGVTQTQAVSFLFQSSSALDSNSLINQGVSGCPKNIKFVNHE